MPEVSNTTTLKSRNDLYASFDPSLYLVINPHQCANGDPVKTARQAVRGGVTAVQVRCKTADDGTYSKIVKEVAMELSSLNIPVFVNDKVDVARTAGVSCIHLGQDDAPVCKARRILGIDALIGLTVRSMPEAENAPLHDIDYVSIGGVFATRSKNNPDDPIGLENLREIYSNIRLRDPDIPIIAISGINESNLDSVLQTGVSGVAVVSAICESGRPQAVAQRLRQRIIQFQSGRVH